MPPPPAGTTAFAPPFDIPESWYQAVLDPKVPITIATVYAVSAKLLNLYNRKNNKRPWAISQTRAFNAFVIAHNVFLAVYSAWTFWGMLGALSRTVVSPLAPTGLAGFADSMCRLSGPAGLGNAATFNEQSGKWETNSPNTGLSASGQPLNTDTGRLWNEGLAFYGWIFYLSKFYEVLDTVIILAKGKQSSTLQTYHHAGAMMCMWAGIRYMAPPIWIFCFVNSFIHALMYTYYTITAFQIRVPKFIKQTLTTMQITQFLVGGSYAMLHSFVYYALPVASNATEKSAPSAAVGSQSSTSVADGVESVYAPCIPTSGQNFATWLNVFYLAPLTYLFMSFFIASYIKRSNAQEKARGKKDRRISSTAQTLAQTAEKAGWDAAKGVQREIYRAGSEEAVVFEDAKSSAMATGKANGRVLRSRHA
jgi:hypothetical protein